MYKLCNRLKLFWIGILLFSSSAFSKDIAVIFSFDCNPRAHFGSDSENEIAVLKNFGWDVHYYCGSDSIEPSEGCTKRIGALTTQNLFCGFEDLKVKDGDNVIVFINTHGTDKHIPSNAEYNEADIAGKKLDWIDGTPEQQGLLVFQENSKVRERQEFFVQQYMELVSQVEKINPKGNNILFNTSCYGGACIQFLPTNSKTCVITGSSPYSVGYSGDFVSIAFQNLPGSKKNYHTKVDKTAINHENFTDEKSIQNELRNQQVELDQTKVKDIKYFKWVASKIKFSNYSLREILKNSMWFNRRKTDSYTHGFNLDKLNVPNEELFIENYRILLANFSEKIKSNAKNIIEEYEEKREASMNTGPVSESYRSGEEVRSQLTALAIAETPSNCGDFNLDRRVKTKPTSSKKD